MAKQVLVLGGRGFIGRHIVKHLRGFGIRVLIGSRSSSNGSHSKDGKRLQLRIQKMQSVADWSDHLHDVDVVVNAVGILRPRWRESYKAVHVGAPQALAAACAKRKIPYIHVSILGLQHALKSNFARSKRQGEQAVMAATDDYYIVRPSLVDGPGGYGAKWFRRIAGWRIQLIPRYAVHKITPIHVDDLGEGVARLVQSTLSDKSQQRRVLELGGPQQMSLNDYISRLENKPHWLRLRIPNIFAYVFCRLFDVLHFTPYSFGHYELLRFDNCPRKNAISSLLGRAARPVGRQLENCSKNISCPPRQSKHLARARRERYQIEL